MAVGQSGSNHSVFVWWFQTQNLKVNYDFFHRVRTKSVIVKLVQTSSNWVRWQTWHIKLRCTKCRSWWPRRPMSQFQQVVTAGEKNGFECGTVAMKPWSRSAMWSGLWWIANAMRRLRSSSNGVQGPVGCELQPEPPHEPGWAPPQLQQAGATCSWKHSSFWDFTSWKAGMSSNLGSIYNTTLHPELPTHCACV